MKLKKIFFYYFIILFLSSEVLSESLYKDSDKSSKYLSNDKLFKDHKNNSNNLFSEFYKLISIDFPEEKSKEEFVLEIESDTFYVEDNKNIYKGNIIMKYKSTTLNSDYLEYDPKNKIITIKDNISFSKNEEYFKADSIVYDQKNKRGNIINIYGIIDFGSVNSNYFSNNKIYKTKNKNIKLQSKNTLNISRNTANDEISEFKFDFTNIIKWRFQSEKIDIFEKELISERMVLTNDPFNPAQIKIISNNFKAKKQKNSINYFTDWNTLIIEDKISIPLGSKSITEKKSKASWSAGYDKNLYDGFFITRNNNPIRIGDDLEFSISSDFLVQRAFQGNSSNK